MSIIIPVVTEKQLRLLVFAMLVCLAAERAALADDTFRFPTIGAKAEQKATLLAIDNHCLPLTNGLCYYMSKPKVRKEPVLTPSLDNPNAPDNRCAFFYGTVLHEVGKFRMWYYGGGRKRTEGPICYAESNDGIHWTKPSLGQVSINGSSDNNAIALPDGRTQGTYVIRDDEDPDANRRYKMVYENYSARLKHMSMRTATSPDGLKWTAGPDTPLNDGTDIGAFYKHDGLYIMGAHDCFRASEGGVQAGAAGLRLVVT